MLRKLATFGLAIPLLIGCGPSQATQMEADVSVSGSVKASGKPVGNVVLKLQPLEQGYEKIIPVDKDGNFTVETKPGKYAYYFTPKEGTKAIPPAVASYAQASMERTVQVASGKPLDIELQ